MLLSSFLFLLLFRSDAIASPSLPPIIFFNNRSGVLREQKLKTYLLRTQSSKVLPLKPGVGQYMAMHATLTTRDFFLASFYPLGSFTSIFFQTSPRFFFSGVVANTGSLVDPQNQLDYPARHRQLKQSSVLMVVHFHSRGLCL